VLLRPAERGGACFDCSGLACVPPGWLQVQLLRKHIWAVVGNPGVDASMKTCPCLAAVADSLMLLLSCRSHQ
jgi:hypothetical protein